MNSYYQDDAVTIYHGDALEVAEWLAADVLLTDPPYGGSWKQNDYKALARSAGQRTKRHASIANDHDTSARDAALLLWGPKPGLVFGAIDQSFPERTGRVLVWRKPRDCGMLGSSLWRRDWEPIFVIGKWPQVPATESSIIDTDCGSHRQYAQGVHPHAKPVDTLTRLLDRAPAGVVADPFMGSGSTLRAAKNLGRRAIGVELDEAYCEIAAKRMAQEVLDFGGVA